MSSLAPALQTGLLDIDICGPSLPHLLGLSKETLHSSASGWSPIYVTPNLSCISIGFLLPSTSSAIIWRGPKKNQLIKQFLKDVDWSGDGGLDYLVVDTPPGTSDEHLSVVQYLKEGEGIDGAVLVTTPQEVSLQDVRKELDFCRKVGVKVLGVVENMSGFVCPSCNGKSEVFFPSTGGAKALAEEGESRLYFLLFFSFPSSAHLFCPCPLHLSLPRPHSLPPLPPFVFLVPAGIPYLGSIPLDPRIGKSCDSGISFLEEYPDSPATQAYVEIVDSESRPTSLSFPSLSCLPFPSLSPISPPLTLSHPSPLIAH